MNKDEIRAMVRMRPGYPVDAPRWLATCSLGGVLLTVSLVGCGDEEGNRGEGTAREKGGGSAATAQPGDGSDWPVDDVAAMVEPSVVQVNVRAAQETSSDPQEAKSFGSGVIYREDGYVITNNHVVEGAEEVNVAFADGTSAKGEVVGTDPFTDLAVVKADRSGLPAADFAEDPSLRRGDLAVAIGSPSGFQSTVAVGVISGQGREFNTLVDLIQTDAALSPGDSGGALANERGQVVGINASYLPPQSGAVNIGFAIPSATAVSVADQIIENGKAVHAGLGGDFTNLTPDIAEQFDTSVKSGVVVTSVDSNGPLSDAGLDTGSIITAIGDEEVRDSGDLLSALRDYKPGDETDLTVASDGGERRVSVKLGERNREN
jgi:serine protease Do